MSENELQLDDEIGLFDLWDRLCEGKTYILGAMAAGVLAALAVIFFASPKFEAVAIVQVGQVGQVGQVVSVPVEPAILAVERMKTPAFQLKAAKTAGDQAWTNELVDSASGSAKDLSVQLVKATSVQGVGALIELRGSASSGGAAIKKVEAAVAELEKVHDALAQPTLSKLRSELLIAKEKMARAEKDSEELGNFVRAASVKDDRFTQLSLMTSVRLQKESEIFGQRQSIMALETALSAPATMPAKAIEAVFVSDKPVSPKKTLLVIIGVIGGLFVGVIWVFIADAWQHARRVRQKS